MLGGKRITEAARENASEMLAAARALRRGEKQDDRARGPSARRKAMSKARR